MDLEHVALLQLIQSLLQEVIHGQGLILQCCGVSRHPVRYGREVCWSGTRNSVV